MAKVGRKRLPKRQVRKPVGVRLNAEDRERIDWASEAVGEVRSEFMRVASLQRAERVENGKEASAE